MKNKPMVLNFTDAMIQQIGIGDKFILEDYKKSFAEEELFDKKKIELLQHYMPRTNGLLYCLASSLTIRQIKSVFDKHSRGKAIWISDYIKDLIEAGASLTKPQRKNQPSVLKVRRIATFLEKRGVNIADGYNERRHFETKKLFTLADVRLVEDYLNQYWRTEFLKWLEPHLDIAGELKEMADRLAKSDSEAREEAEELRRMVKKLERLKKFDRTRYDRNIFEEADELYKKAVGINKQYGLCLLAVLKGRGIAKDDAFIKNEFQDWNNSYKQWRSNRP